MRKYLTEFIGTFFLVLTIGLTARADVPMAPIAIGSVLMVMVYMGGHISGAHYNPAVSLGILLRGKITTGEFLTYALCQTAGAIAAALGSYAVLGHTFAPAPGATVAATGALMLEVLYTFALVLVVLNVAVSAKTKGNSYYGLAIGFTVGVGATSAGALSGGAFNPAVGLGPTIVNAALGGGTFAHLWLYIVGPLAGGALAAGVFVLQEADSVSASVSARQAAGAAGD